MQDMEAPQEAPEREQGGDATKLAQTVGDGLSKLADMLNGSPGATDADKEKMAMVLNGFIELVEGNLGSQAPGEDAPPEEPEGPAVVPAMAGAKGVPMGPNTRM